MIKKLKGINKVFFVAVLVLIVIISGCSNNAPTSEEAKVVNITPSEAKLRLDTEEGLILLDVRTKEEYEAGHIEGSILIPVDIIEAEAEGILQDKEKPILVYCRSGNRSVVAANILVKLGYENVYNLGGINDWPYEIEKNSGK